MLKWGKKGATDGHGLGTANSMQAHKTIPCGKIAQIVIFDISIPRGRLVISC